MLCISKKEKELFFQIVVDRLKTNLTSEPVMKTLKLIKSSGVIFVTAGIITVIAESIGVIKVSALGVNFSLLPMLYAVIIGVLVTPDLIGKYIRPLGNILNHDAIKKTGNIVMISLLPLGVKYGTLVGPMFLRLSRPGQR